MARIPLVQTTNPLIKQIQELIRQTAGTSSEGDVNAQVITDRLFRELGNAPTSEDIGTAFGSVLAQLSDINNRITNVHETLSDEIVITRDELQAGINATNSEISSVSETIRSRILLGLEVVATVPPTTSVIVGPGVGVAGGKKWTLPVKTEVVIPFDTTTQIFYINLWENQVQVERSRHPQKVAVAKVVVPSPGLSGVIQNDKPGFESFDAWIVSGRDLTFENDFAIDDETIGNLRNIIDVVLAENLIGNIRLADDLTITNVSGQLLLDVFGLKLKDENKNKLLDLNKDGMFIFNSKGKQRARFTGDEAILGENITIDETGIVLENGASLTVRGNGIIKVDGGGGASTLISKDQILIGQTLGATTTLIVDAHVGDAFLIVDSTTGFLSAGKLTIGPGDAVFYTSKTSTQFLGIEPIGINSINQHHDQGTNVVQVANGIDLASADGSKIFIDINGVDGQHIHPQTITTKSIAANAITADEIAAKAITADKIIAGEITADKFNSTLFGDLNQAIRYVQAQLGSNPEFEDVQTNSDLVAGTLNQLDISDDKLEIETQSEWDDVGVTWDSGNWDQPLSSSGTFISSDQDSGASITGQFTLNTQTIEETAAATTMTVDAQYSTDGVSFGSNSPDFNDDTWIALTESATGGGSNFTGSILTFRHFKVRITLATTIDTENITVGPITYQIDKTDITATLPDESITAGGTSVTYSGFTAVPSITITPVSATPLISVVSSKTSSSATVELFNLSGVSVTGTADIHVIGG